MPAKARPARRRQCLRCCALAVASLARPAPGQESDVSLRIATYNLEDVRTADLLADDQPRLLRLAETIARLRPNIILLNEIAYDLPGGPDVPTDADPGLNTQRFLDRYLSRVHVGDQEPIRYRAFMAPSNTGIPSGHDLDNSGQIVNEFPAPPPSGPDGSPGRQTPAGRTFGGDCWGFGTFPGQYAMALLVDERLTVVQDEVRTFQLLPWSYMPGALAPIEPATGKPWYDADEWSRFRLSSKSHWDVPVRLPNGTLLHVLASHPTPPAFDGPEQRNARRNHDEIRFWAEYLSDAPWLVDDKSQPGGLERGAPFVLVGDLNADPNEGSALDDPVALILKHPRVGKDPAPQSDIVVERLDPDDTSQFGLRVDYVLPSANIALLAAGIWRGAGIEAGGPPSDHFPVWADVSIPPTVVPIVPGAGAP